MSTRALVPVLFAVLVDARPALAQVPAKGDSYRAPIRVVDQTVIVGDSDPLLWKTVLDLLPARPRRIELLDLDSLSNSTRQKLRGIDAFVLAGQTTVVVIQQGATLRRATFGDALDRLVLASLVWHELAHANGLDERAALEHEQMLWRRFIASGHVDSGHAMAYMERLREAAAAVTNGS